LENYWTSTSKTNSLQKQISPKLFGQDKKNLAKKKTLDEILKSLIVCCQNLVVCHCVTTENLGPIFFYSDRNFGNGKIHGDQKGGNWNFGDGKFCGD
jgi:hypothetical protein